MNPTPPSLACSRYRSWFCNALGLAPFLFFKASAVGVILFHLAAPCVPFCREHLCSHASAATKLRFRSLLFAFAVVALPGLDQGDVNGIV
jgi:hypothetical protein